VGPRAGLEVCEKSCPHRDFFFLIALISSVSCTFVQVSFLCPIVLRAVDFSIMKNPTASVGSEPAILGSRGQHANPQTTEAADSIPGPSNQ
jgi:hypothetical protein